MPSRSMQRSTSGIANETVDGAGLGALADKCTGSGSDAETGALSSAPYRSGCSSGGNGTNAILGSSGISRRVPTEVPAYEAERFVRTEEGQ